MIILQSSSSEGLNKLVEFIQDNEGILDRSLMNELADIHKLIDQEIVCLDEETYDLWRETEELKNDAPDLLALSEEIDDIFKFRTDEDINEIESKIKSAIEDFSKPKEKKVYTRNDNGETKADIFKRMIKMGYTFNSETMELYSEKKEEAAKIEKPELKVLKWAKIEKMNESQVHLTAYKIDVMFDSSTNKLTGKGARKEREEIMQRLDYYFKYENIGG